VSDEALTPLEKLEAARAARKLKNLTASDDQRFVDMQALDAAEIEYGDESVTYLEVPFSPGLPTLIVARIPTENELKVYRHKMKPQQGRGGKMHEADTVETAELMADYCVVYPPKGDIREKFYAARPGVKAQIGMHAVMLTLGHKEAVGKE
jgi:hypothetical protein